MALSRIYATLIRQWLLIKENPVRLAPIFLWIVFDIIQWGFITKYIGSFGAATFSFVTFILGAIILWEFLSRIQQGIMTAFLEDIWTQNFINYFASPLRINEYIGGLVLTSIFTGLAGFGAMLLIASLVFGYNIFHIGLMLLPFILIIFIFAVALGTFVTAIIFKLGPSAEWFGWPIPFVLSIFSGVYYPTTALPYALQLFSKLIPASYVFDNVRSVLAHGTYSGPSLIIGGALAIAYLLAAYYFFIRVYRANLKTGAIARFNAE